MSTILGVWTVRDPEGEVSQVRMLDDGNGHYLLQDDGWAGGRPSIRSSELTEIVRHLGSTFGELQARGGSVVFEKELTNDPDSVMITMTENMVAHASESWRRAADADGASSED